MPKDKLRLILENQAGIGIGKDFAPRIPIEEAISKILSLFKDTLNEKMPKGTPENDDIFIKDFDLGRNQAISEINRIIEDLK